MPAPRCGPNWRHARSAMCWRSRAPPGPLRRGHPPGRRAAHRGAGQSVAVRVGWRRRQGPPLPRLGLCPLGPRRSYAHRPGGAVLARPARAESVGQGCDTTAVVAVDPAAHRHRVAAKQVGDGNRGPAALRQQDHDQAGTDMVGAMEQAGHLAGAAGRVGSAVGLAYTLGGRILAAASRVVWCVEASNGPRGYCVLRCAFHQPARAQPWSPA